MLANPCIAARICAINQRLDNQDITDASEHTELEVWTKDELCGRQSEAPNPSEVDNVGACAGTEPNSAIGGCSAPSLAALEVGVNNGVLGCWGVDDWSGPVAVGVPASSPRMSCATPK